MRKLFKILMFFVIIVILLIVTLSIVAKLSENKIADLALEKVSETINLPIEIESVSFTLLRKFPLATIEFKGVWLGSPNPIYNEDSSITLIDTIAHFDKIYLSVKSKPLLEKNIELIKLELQGVDLRYFVDIDGKSNIDFLLDTAQTEEQDTSASTILNVALRELSLKDITCNYEDKTLMAKAKLTIPDLKIKGSIHGESLEGSANGTISLTESEFGDTKLHLMESTLVNFDVDYRNDSVSLNNVNINTDGAELKLSGEIILSDILSANLNVLCEALDVSELQKYTPKEILDEYGLKNAGGLISFNAKINGPLNDSTKLPHLDLEIKMENGSIETKEYPSIKNVEFSGVITNGFLNNNQTTSAVFDAFYIETEKSKINLALSIQDLDHLKYSLQSELALDLAEFKSYIPDSLIQDIDGIVNLNLNTKGELPDSIDEKFVDYLLGSSTFDVSFHKLKVKLDSTFSVDSLSGKLSYAANQLTADNLKFSLPEYSAEIRKISFVGSYTGRLSDLSSIGINLNKLKFQSNLAAISGDVQVKNLESPEYNLDTDIRIYLNKIAHFVPDTLLKQLSGNIAVGIRSNGTLDLDSIANQVNELIFEKSRFNVRFSNVSLEIANKPVWLNKLYGRIILDPDQLDLKQLSGNFSGLDFNIDSTIIKNLYASVIQGKPDTLFVESNIKLGDIDYSTLIPLVSLGEKESSDSASVEKTNEKKPAEKEAVFNYMLKGKLSVKSITNDKKLIDNVASFADLSDSTVSLLYSYLKDTIEFTDISALYNVRPGHYIIDQFYLNGFGGSMSTSLRYVENVEGYDGNTILWMRNIVSNMNVERILEDLNNFNQSEVTHENLSGILSLNIDNEFQINESGFLQDKMRVSGEITLKKGAVYNFEPATSMSKFTGIKELDNIQFKTLKSNFFVFKDTIFVPETHIVSTALDIDAFGMQTLRENYEYHLEVHLDEILLGKSKKLLEQQSKMGDVAEENNRNSVFLLSYKEDGKTKSGFDKKKKKNLMRFFIRKARRLLDVRFNPINIDYDTGVEKSK